MLGRLGGRSNELVHELGRRPAVRWAAGASGLALAAAAVATVTLSTAAPAGATASPSYNPGADSATLSVTGVRDSNCLVSTGGDQVFIKPGDSLTLNSDLAGVDVAGLSIGSGSVAGLNVRAVIDANTTAQKSLTITAGQSVQLTGLSSGRHTLAWTATGIPLVSGLLGSAGTLPLSSSQLQSGAKLSWAGHIFVTQSADQCRIAALTPRADVSLGPVHVSAPSANIGVSVPSSVPSKLGSSSSQANQPTSTRKTGKAKAPRKAASNGLSVTIPGLTIPQLVVPRDGGNLPAGSSVGGGGGQGALGDSSTQLTGGYATAPDGSRIKIAAIPGSSSNSGADAKTVDLASSNPDAGTGQLPVILAILAVITLALVAGTYARMFLLRRPTS